MHSMRELEQSLRDEMKERADEIRDETYPEDMVSEMADGWVPIYTYDIMQYAADDIDLAVVVPEIGPAFNGEPSAVNIIAANIYERLQRVAFEEWQDIEEATV